MEGKGGLQRKGQYEEGREVHDWCIVDIKERVKRDRVDWRRAVYW